VDGKIIIIKNKNKKTNKKIKNRFNPNMVKILNDLRKNKKPVVEINCMNAFTRVLWSCLDYQTAKSSIIIIAPTRNNLQIYILVQ